LSVGFSLPGSLEELFAGRARRNILGLLPQMTRFCDEPIFQRFYVFEKVLFHFAAPSFERAGAR
jgi:hypothetical protein